MKSLSVGVAVRLTEVINKMCCCYQGERFPPSSKLDFVVPQNGWNTLTCFQVDQSGSLLNENETQLPSFTHIFLHPWQKQKGKYQLLTGTNVVVSFITQQSRSSGCSRDQVTAKGVPSLKLALNLLGLGQVLPSCAPSQAMPRILHLHTQFSS